MITLNLDTPIKLVIVSYRSNYFIREGCSCHPEYQTGDSDFDIGVVEGLQKAADYIADRLLDGILADHSHIIFEDFESALEVRNTSSDARNISIPGEWDRPRREKAKAFVPGNITWPYNYENQYEIIEGTEPPINAETRIEILLGHLHKLVEDIFMKKFRHKNHL